MASGLQVFLQTNVFRDEPQSNEGVFFPFPIPSSDTSYIIRIAKKCIRYLFKEGYKYHKAGIALLDIIPAHIQQEDMFTQHSKKNETLMKSIDAINAKMGRQTVFYCAEGIERQWQMKRNKRSHRYTTRWDELPLVTLHE
jgi:DNA polymerase V